MSVERDPESKRPRLSKPLSDQEQASASSVGAILQHPTSPEAVGSQQYQQEEARAAEPQQEETGSQQQETESPQEVGLEGGLGEVSGDEDEVDGDTRLAREPLMADENPLVPQAPTKAFADMVTKADLDPAGLRAWIQARAQADAAICCGHGEELVMWKKNAAIKASTCGRLQAFYRSQIDLKEVHQRQVQRERYGDNVGYPLARTVRSMAQFNAAKLGLGCRGAGNQVDRGTCMKAAMSMFEGSELEGLPQVVTRALLLH